MIAANKKLIALATVAIVSVTAFIYSLYLIDDYFDSTGDWGQSAENPLVVLVLFALTVVSFAGAIGSLIYTINWSLEYEKQNDR